MDTAAPGGPVPADVDDVTTLPELLSASKGGLPGIPSSDLARPAAAEYLRTITSLSLASLQNEPARIKDECTAIESELTHLCFREHRTFIEVHRCADDVQDALAGFGDSLDRLLEAVPPLERECEAFAVSTRGIQQARRRATLVLEHQDKLLDLLEIPQLMDTCVRNGYYQEAMELYAHANKLAKRYADVPIVRSVQAEVTSVMQLQFAQLLAVLREPVKLPALVKAVGFLRRMGRLPEDELRIAFLESRDFHFQMQLTGLERDRSDKVRFTRRYVDLFRENIYDAISQYGSIFLDPVLFADADDGASAAAMDVLVIFCHRAIDDLMAVLDQTFPHIQDTSSLSSLLTQLGYCALSFARVGLDFSNRLVKPFEKAVLDLTVKGFNEAAQALITTIKDASRLSRSPSTWMCASEHVAAITSAETSPPSFPSLDDSVSVAPTFLTTYPPLAIYLNGALSALNSLRLLAPLSLQDPILRLLDESLAHIVTEVLAYARSTLHQTANAPTRPAGLRRNNSIGNQGVSAEVRSERNTAAKRILCAFAAAFLEGVVPHLRRALVQGVYAADADRLAVDSAAPAYTAALAELHAWVQEHRSIEVEPAVLQDKEEDAQVTEASPDMPTTDLAVSVDPAAVNGVERTTPRIDGLDPAKLSLSQVSDAVGRDASSRSAEAAGGAGVTDEPAAAAFSAAKQTHDDGASGTTRPEAIEEQPVEAAEVRPSSPQHTAGYVVEAPAASEAKVDRRTAEASSGLAAAQPAEHRTQEDDWAIVAASSLSGAEATPNAMGDSNGSPRLPMRTSPEVVVEQDARNPAEPSTTGPAVAAEEAASRSSAAIPAGPEEETPSKSGDVEPEAPPTASERTAVSQADQPPDVSSISGLDRVEELGSPADGATSNQPKVGLSSDDIVAASLADQVHLSPVPAPRKPEKADSDAPAGATPADEAAPAVAPEPRSEVPSEAEQEPPASGAQTPADEEDEANGQPDEAPAAECDEPAASQPAKTGGSKGKNKKKKKKK